MPLEFTCPCGQRFLVPETGFPRTVSCHACGLKTILEDPMGLPLAAERGATLPAAGRGVGENSGFAAFFLTVGQAITGLGCAAMPIVTAWQVQDLLRFGYPWLALLAVLGGFLGFCINAAMWIVFTRVKQLGHR
jgi:hypothetical protein